MTFPRHIACLLMFGITMLGCDSGDDTTIETTTEETTVAPKAVYVLSNRSGSNSVLTYTRSTDGSLAYAQETTTGGSGTGTTLDGACRSLVYDPTYGVLYAVNAGSNSLSAFYVNSDGSLQLLDTQNTQGVRPVSVAVAATVVYVVNQGDESTPANVAGFIINEGDLIPIDDSAQALSTDLPAPGQVAFTSTPNVIVTSESATSSISAFPLNTNLAAYGRNTQPSLGATPIGLGFTPAGVMVVSEAQGDESGLASASSYVVGGDGSLVTASDQVASQETGAGSVLVLSNGSFAFVANPLSDAISTYSLDSNGGLTFQQADASTGGPHDLAVSDDETFLYALNREAASLSIFSLDRDTGALVSQGELSGLPAGSSGLAAR